MARIFGADLAVAKPIRLEALIGSIEILLGEGAAKLPIAG